MPADLELPWHRVRLAIVVVDMVESVRLMESHESALITYWRHFVQLVRTELLPQHRGRMVKSLGDGMLLTFKTAPDALSAAQALQQLSAQLPFTVEVAHVSLRIGINMAEVVEDELDVYGAGVNIAARLAANADPGGTWLSATVHDELSPGVDGDLVDLGDIYLKHVQHPLRTYKALPVGMGPHPGAPQRALDDLRPAVAMVPLLCRDDTDPRHVMGDLLADEVTVRLARSSDWRVISKLSAAAFAGRSFSLQQMAPALRVDYLCTGAYQRFGDRLSLQLQLVHAASAQVIWADSLRCSAADVLAGTDPVTTVIADGIASAIFGHGLAATSTTPLPQLRSHELLQGAIALMHRARHDEFDRALQLIEALEQRHPRAVLPSAWRAKWHVLRVVQGWSTDPHLDGNLALQAGRRAADADGHSALALAMQGLVHAYLRQDFDAAARCYDAALVENPHESLALLLRGTMHAFLAQGGAAFAETQQALALSPLDPLRYFYLSLAASAAVADGRYDAAIDLAQTSLALNRVHLSTYRALAMAQSLAGHLPEAASTISRLLQLDPGFTVTRFLERFPGRERAPDFTHRLADALGRAGLPH